MKINNLLFLVLFSFFLACTSKRIPTTSTTGSDKALCFINTSATSPQTNDTTSVRLFIKNNKVEGDYTLKSGGRVRSGILDGNLRKDTIRALWIYNLGEIRTSENLMFIFNSKTNTLVQQTSNKSDSAVFKTVDCDKLPLGGFNIQSTDRMSPPDSVLCFMKTEGLDTTAVRLYLLSKNNLISGDYVWNPDGKDSRIGTIQGTLKGDSVNAVWKYMQEGTINWAQVRFRLQNNWLIHEDRFGRDSIIMQKVGCEGFRLPGRAAFVRIKTKLIQ